MNATVDNIINKAEEILVHVERTVIDLKVGRGNLPRAKKVHDEALRLYGEGVFSPQAKITISEGVMVGNMTADDEARLDALDDLFVTRMTELSHLIDVLTALENIEETDASRDWPKLIRHLFNVVIVLGVLCSLATLVFAQEQPLMVQRTIVIGMPVIIDGDTISLDGTRIRLLDIDTPETHRPRCDAEYIKGLEAKQALRELLSSGIVSYEAHGRDRYNRVLAYVFVNDRDVGMDLMGQGLALRWTPGRASWLRRAQHWCPDYVEGTEL